MVNIGIIGHGIVGKSVGYGFGGVGDIVVLYHDKHLNSAPLEYVISHSDFVFVCVPTPYKSETGEIDLSIMDETIENVSKYLREDGIIVIKSTVIPGTTRNYSERYSDNKFCFNPEFLTEANPLEDFVNTDRVIIGADNEDIGLKVESLYRMVFKRIPLYQTDTIDAETTKYVANIFLAMKVIFANEIEEVCSKMGADYNVVRELIAADSRIGESHLIVAPERGFGGKCFPKDIMAFINLCNRLEVDISLIKEVWKKNLNIRSIRDWEEIPSIKS